MVLSCTAALLLVSRLAHDIAGTVASATDSAAALLSPEQPAQSVTDASGGGAGKKLSTVAIHLDLHSSRRDLPQPPLDIPDEKPTEHI